MGFSIPGRKRRLSTPCILVDHGLTASRRDQVFLARRYFPKERAVQYQVFRNIGLRLPIDRETRGARPLDL